MYGVKRVGVLGVLLAVALCGNAQAGTTHVGSDDLYSPTEADLAEAVQVARDYWGPPACGEPRVEWRGTVSGGEGGLAHTDPRDPDYCSIDIAHADPTGSFTPGGFCLVVAHEWGHLRLGPAFADVNPANPTHSPDPHNVMYPSMTGYIAAVPGCQVFDARRSAKAATHARHHHRRELRRRQRR